MGYNQRALAFEAKPLAEPAKKQMLDASRVAREMARDMNFFKVYATLLLLHNSLASLP